MTRSSLYLTALALLFPSSLSLAQASPKVPEPRPEHKRLNYFAGIWDFRLEMKQSPFGPGGTVTGTDQNEILPGGFFLARRYETKSPVGEFKGLEVIGYDVEANSYIQYGFNNFGEAHTYKGHMRPGSAGKC